jgi:hypothetical protein
MYHYIALDAVESVEGGSVRLNKTAAEATQPWH